MSTTLADLGSPPRHGADASHDAAPNGIRLAQAGCAVGLLFAAVSAYWALGGTWLRDTISDSLTTRGGAAWAAVVLKVIAAVLPLLALRQLTSRAGTKGVLILAWAAAAIMTTYGLVLTAVGLLVQAGVLHASPPVNERGLAWHAYLWDPWFLVWGLLVAAALMRHRHHRG